MNPKLSSTVSVVKLKGNILEFFKTNTRQQLRIKVEDDTILNITKMLDGQKTIKEIALESRVDEHDLLKLIEYLRKNGIIDTVDPKKDFESYDKFRRIIHFLSDYSSSHENLLDMWNKIINSKVLIIGLGAVGSWVVCNLVQSGVKNIILMDNDKVDVTNLHRQFGYTERDIGKYKLDVIEERLIKYNPEINIEKKYCFLDDSTLEQIDNNFDLIINCADKPNVDTTSLWVGEYGMKHNIPHIIGGGYNLHLSLIGQTVIPGKSSCVKCFEKKLSEDNKIDANKVKKLAVKNRKVGSFAPMCSLISSMIGMEAIKILSGNILPANINRRGEFDIYKMDISYKEYTRMEECEWCGKKGKYYSL